MPRSRRLRSTKSSKTATKRQLRIIGGQYKRRLIHFREIDGLRPTPDRLRETLFNWLQADISGSRCLDIFAGSGVLGLESLSRGADYCTFVELSVPQSNQLQQTIDTLGCSSRARVYQSDAIQWLHQGHVATLTPFDIIFIDPPYAANLWQSTLDGLTAGQLIDASSLLYIEADQKHEAVFDTSVLHCIKSTRMGSIYASLYQLDID